MEIHQVVVSAAPGDAITNMAVQLRTLLRAVGPSEIFARFLDPAFEGDIIPLSSYLERKSARTGRNLLIFHSSIGQADVLSFLLERPEAVVLLYHNITPAHFFVPYDLGFARHLADGRSALLALRHRVRLALAVSEYNAEELLALGYPDVRVSPPVVDVRALASCPAHEPTANHLREVVCDPLLLFVGQLLPHKRPDFLLQAFYILATQLVPEANLALIGPMRLPSYQRALQTFLQENNLPNAWICGMRTEGELVAFYQRADLFVTASEHEGFCIPLVEAMAFGTPTLARRCAAIPQTLGDGGVLLPPDAGPALFAEAMAAVIEDRVLAKEMSAKAAGRAEDFDVDEAKATFIGHLTTIL